MATADGTGAWTKQLDGVTDGTHGYEATASAEPFSSDSLSDNGTPAPAPAESEGAPPTDNTKDTLEPLARQATDTYLAAQERTLAGDGMWEFVLPAQRISTSFYDELDSLALDAAGQVAVGYHRR